MLSSLPLLSALINGGVRCSPPFSVPPSKPRIFDQRGQEVMRKLGPYKVGDSVVLKCVATGGEKSGENLPRIWRILRPFFAGQPSPRVTWWRDHALLDDSVDEVRGAEVTNELRLGDLARGDLHAALTCQASNNNLSVPASTSVRLDMHCEFYYLILILQQ